MNLIGDQELLKANPDLTKRFLKSCDNNGINFLEMSSRFYGVMPKELLKKVVSLYDKNAEPDSIKLTIAILSLPKDLFDSLSGKIDMKNIEEFTNANFKEKIAASRKEVGLSPLAIYVEEGYEKSVVANLKKINGLPYQAGLGKVTDDNTFNSPNIIEGTITSEKFAQMGEKFIRENFNRTDLNDKHRDAIINAILKNKNNENPTAAKMAEENAKSNILSLLEKKLDVCSTGVYNPAAQGIFNSDKRSGYYI